MAVTGAASTQQVDPAPGRALFLSARLFVAADAFFWLGFLFAYLYLRALDSNHAWHPSGTDPSVALGTVAALCVLGAAVALRFGVERTLRPGVAGALLLTAVAFVCEGIQLFDPGFSPIHGGGYGAVFVGFSAAMVAHLLGALYWVETLFVDRESGAEERIMQARAASVFMSFLAGVAVVAYVLIYLV
jgi:heme/copper-type cytochrome/quinol oxidase subunit 3